MRDYFSEEILGQKAKRDYFAEEILGELPEEEELSWIDRLLRSIKGAAPEVRLKEKVPLIEAAKGLLPKREVEPIPQFPAGFQLAEAVTTRVERPSISPEPILRVPTEEERRTGLFARPAIRAAEPEKAMRPLGSAISKRVEKVLQPGKNAEENAVKDVVRFAYGIPEFISSVGTGLLDAVATADTFEELMDNIVSPIGRAGGEMVEGIRKWFEIVSYQISPLEGRGGYEKYERDLEEFNQTPLGPAISLWVAKGVAKQVGGIPKIKRIAEVTDYMKAQASRLKETPKVVSGALPLIREPIKPTKKILGKAEMELAKELKAEGVTEKPRKGYRFERTGPGIMGGVRSVGQEASVQRVVNALKEAKPLRKEQEVLYSKERAAKIARLMAVRKKTTGEAGFYAEKGQLKGELPKLEFASIRSKISQTDIDNLFNKVRDSGFLTEFEKVTAREGLVKMFGEHGGRVPTKGELTLLEQVFPLEFIETVMAKRPLWTKIKEAGWQLANIPRSVMASFDLSFGGRQGAFAAPRYRREFFNAWKKQFKIFGSEKAYQASREALTKHPDFMFAKESKISFTELGKIMTKREEMFMSQWAEKIPIVGKGIRASSRAYTSFANQFRMDMFSRMVKDAETLGLNPRKNPILARKTADFINNATGRGSLGSFETAAVVLNAFFFSPRLNMARMRLLNPAYYIRQPKFVRTQALKTALTASGTAVTMLTLSNLIPGVEAGTNPLSADFGKIKIRNTRLDILAGFGQFIRAGAQIAMGKTISTVTGKETILGEGYKPRTRLDVALQQVEYKESPIFSFVTTLLKGKDFEGKDVSIPKEVGRRFVPMVIADMVELIKEDPQLLPLSIPAIFGMGLQTYAHPYAALAKAEKEHGFMSEEWKKVRDKIEESGFKYKYKNYLEWKKGMLP